MSVKNNILLYTLLLFAQVCTAQKLEIGCDISRAYFHYKYRDYGMGYSNLPSANHGVMIGANLDVHLNRGLFVESGLRFIQYEQYYGTRLYGTAWEQRNPVLAVPAVIGYNFQQSKIGISCKGGFLLGFMTRNFISDYYAMIRYELNPIDSLTRGTMYRDFTKTLPMVSLEFSIDYKLASRWEAGIRLGGAKGFTKITEFDIYYNDGNGKNDQHARQWGYGDYLSIGLGIKYTLKDKKKN